MKSTFVTILLLLSVTALAGNYIGKIVFSKKPIDSKTAESLPPTEFQVGDKIYCWVFLTQPLSNYKLEKYFSSVYTCCTKIFFDGTEIKSDVCMEANNFTLDQAKTVVSFSFELGYWKAAEQLYDNYQKAVNGLQTGVHSLSVNITLLHSAKKPGILASGECKLNKMSGSKLKLGASFNAVEEIPNKKTLADSALTLLRKVLPTSQIDAFDGEVLAAKITTEWDILYHKTTGAILGRVCNVVAFEKKKDGTCRASKYCLKQDFAGNGYLKKLTFEGRRVSSWDVDCE